MNSQTHTVLAADLAATRSMFRSLRLHVTSSAPVRVNGEDAYQMVTVPLNA